MDLPIGWDTVALLDEGITGRMGKIALLQSAQLMSRPSIHATSNSGSLAMLHGLISCADRSNILASRAVDEQTRAGCSRHM